MAKRRRWGLWGAAAGVLLGLLDAALGRLMRVEIETAVALYFTGSFAILGYAIGRLVEARARAREDAQTIERQMRALEASQRAVLQNEKLAAIGRLAAGIAHEVRNPLGVIRASASMIQESFDAHEEAHRACQFIRDEIDRLNGLITALLAFARPAQPRFQSVSLEKVTDRGLQLAAEALARRQVTVEREYSASVADCSADPDLIAQVVLDLVTNAAEAVEPGGRVVLRTDGDVREVSIDVADDGPGVDPADAEQIFEPFFTTKAAGTGLGLAMAARIVETHNGRLELEMGRGAGADGRGACFCVRLPVARGEVAAKERA